MIALTITSIDAVFYTAVFLLPGFIMNAIIEKTNPPSRHYAEKFFLRCFAFSILSCACYSWAYQPIIKNGISCITLYWLQLILISIVGSTVLAIFISMIMQKHYIDKILQFTCLNTIHSIPNAWDYVFSKQKECFVIVTLYDDTKIKGWYSTKSFAASGNEETDLFLPQLY